MSSGMDMNMNISMEMKSISTVTGNNNANNSNTNINSSIHANDKQTINNRPSPLDDNDNDDDSYVDPSSNDLTTLSGAMLIVADCMGTGILALPGDMQILGMGFGLFFLFLNLPINLYAGTILSRVASVVEKRLEHTLSDSNTHGHRHSHSHSNASSYNNNNGDHGNEHDDVMTEQQRLHQPQQQQQQQQQEYDWDYTTYDKQQKLQQTTKSNNHIISDINNDDENIDFDYASNSYNNANINATPEQQEQHHHHGIDTPHTFDFIGITSALFDHHPNNNNNHNNSTSDSNKHIHTISNNNNHHNISKTTIIVTITYYTNIFLVLGNYILVMSHAVAAMIGEENICLPIAGIIASTLMFGISQLRSMSSLGREASFFSLLALAIVVLQCLSSIQTGSNSFAYENSDNGNNGNNDEIDDDDDLYHRLTQNNYYDQGNSNENENENEDNNVMFTSIMRQLAALSSIGFAVGSQKLLLNIRHEFKDREQAAPHSLGIALSGFGAIYGIVCIMAGPNPPEFLFDAIPSGSGRRIAGLLLWIHVAVSFAINSQALCSSIDRLSFHRVSICSYKLNNLHKTRWALLTFLVAISSYMIANAIPFFKDLVSLIGAFTSVPLTLLLPAIFHRKIRDLPIWKMEFHSLMSSSSSVSSSMTSLIYNDLGTYLLLVFSAIFLVCGVIGSLSSISIDWKNHGPPFACH